MQGSGFSLVIKNFNIPTGRWLSHGTEFWLHTGKCPDAENGLCLTISLIYGMTGRFFPDLDYLRVERFTRTAAMA